MSTFDTARQQIEELRAIKLQQPEVYKKIVEAMFELEGWQLEPVATRLKDPQIDRVAAYKENLFLGLSAWRNSVDPGFRNKTLYDCCQAILKLIDSANTDLQLNLLKKDYEPSRVAFAGCPISGRQAFDDVEADRVSFILRKGDAYHSPSIESASNGEFIKMEVSPNATVTEKDGYVVIGGKVGSKIEYNRVVSSPSPPEVFPEVKNYTIKHPGNRDLVLSLPAGATLTDGYHTFEELYAHRNLLFINLVKLLVLECNYLAWCTKADDQWFVLTTCPLDEPCEQISYHIKMDMYEMCIDFADDIPRDFDGHTSDDVLERLKNLL